MIWQTAHPAVDLGFIPDFLSEFDERPAREQFNENYAHGGGWRPVANWSLIGAWIKYPGDQELYPIAWTQLRDELIYLYESAWICVVQPDGSFEVARMD